MPRSCPVHGLLYLDFKEVPRKPGAANVTPVKAKTKKGVKREQLTAKIAPGVVKAALGPSALASASQIKGTHIRPQITSTSCAITLTVWINIFRDFFG